MIKRRLFNALQCAVLQNTHSRTFSLSALLTACMAFQPLACAKPDRSSAASTSVPSGAFKPLAVGDRAPFYSTVTLQGDSIRIGATGEPVTVMNVWATWCTSCREEMADLEALHREFPTGVRVVAVSVDATDINRVREFVKRERLTFDVAHDPDGNVQQLYQVVGIPGTYVVGRDGRLLWKSVGNVHGVIDSLRAVLLRTRVQ